MERNIPGVLKLLRLLTSHGADIHKRNKRRWTPLDEAVLEKGHKIVIRLLHEVGARLCPFRSSIDPALDLMGTAIVADHTRMLKVLIKTHCPPLDLNASQAEWGHGILHFCLRSKKHDGDHVKLSTLKVLQANGIDINARDSMGRTLLHRACGRNHISNLAELIALGKWDLDAKDGDGKTALQTAKEAGREGHVKILLQHGAKESKVALTSSFLYVIAYILSGGIVALVFYCSATL